MSTGRNNVEAPTLRVLRVPSRLEVHTESAEDPTTITGVRWDAEVRGYVIDTETGEPTRIRTCGVFAEKPTSEEVLGLLMTWFEHEMREQLGMDPHRPAAAEPEAKDDVPFDISDGEAREAERVAAEAKIPRGCPICGKRSYHHHRGTGVR